MAETDANGVMRQHLRRFFAGHACEEHQWTLGPAVDEFPIGPRWCSVKRRRPKGFRATCQEKSYDPLYAAIEG
jgi:hypothetical protein